MIESIRNLIITLIMALLGGYLFQLLRIPAPYLLGSLAITWLLGRLIKPKLFKPSIPRWLQISVLVSMSVLIGGAFSPSLINHASLWATTVVSMIATTLIATLTGYLFLSRIRKYDHNLAILCSLPGGQAEIVAISQELVEKDYIVIFFHLVRVTTVFCLTPLILAFVKGQQGIVDSYVELDNLLSIVDLPLITLFQFLVIAISGYALARLIKLPMPHLLGPMILSGGLHISGFIEIPRISELVILAQVTIASAIGARLSQVKLRELSSYIGDALINSMMIISIYSLAAFLLSSLGYSEFIQMLLAYIPGGLYEVSLLALIFGYDLAFVALHHSIRFIQIFILLPFIIHKKK